MASVAVALAVAGCSPGGDGSTGGTAPGDGERPYVELRLAMLASPGTRANPTGGESGDGAEGGQDYENAVSSAVAFFFRGSNGVNSPAGTPIEAVELFPQFVQSGGSQGAEPGVDYTYTTMPKQVGLSDGRYDVIVVANPGADPWWEDASRRTLGAVRDYICEKAWTVSGGVYSGFVMTSAADASLTVASNPASSPATVTVGMERMAARIDYKTAGTYTCTEAPYKGSTVEIKGAAIVNGLTAGSYLLKRVADDADGTGAVVLGDETAGSDGKPANYVIDPWTAGKTGRDASFEIAGKAGLPPSALYSTWFGNQYYDSGRAATALDLPATWDALTLPGTDIGGWRRIGYTLENTTSASAAGWNYSTGVVFKAVFHPYGLANYADGSTFFSLGQGLYASVEDIMSAVYGAEFDKFDGMIDACQSWEDVKAFSEARLIDDDHTGYKAYVDSRIAQAQPFGEAVKESLKWGAYMLSEYGYSAVRGAGGNWVVTINQGGIATRGRLRAFDVHTYEGAICYYTWWVRHGNDSNDDGKGPMEYAIVRNNVYKLEVTDISALGGDVPGDETLMVNIYVRDWLLQPTATVKM